MWGAVCVSVGPRQGDAIFGSSPRGRGRGRRLLRLRFRALDSDLQATKHVSFFLNGSSVSLWFTSLGPNGVTVTEILAEINRVFTLVTEIPPSLSVSFVGS